MEQQTKAPAETRNVVNFLRSKSGMKIRTGVLNGKRVDYFKGKAAVKALQSPAYAKTKGVPPVTNDEEAVKLLHSIIPFTFFLRVDRGPPSGGAKSPKMVQINPMQMFAPDQYYAWFYEGSQWKLILGGFGMVAVILAGVMFPLWPMQLRIGVWYLSIAVLGLIGLFFAIAIFRLIFYVITLIVARPGIWIFPNLFADVGFVDSFIPLYEWDYPKKKSKGKKKKDGGKGEGKKSKKSKGAVEGGSGKEDLSARPAVNGGKDQQAKIVELGSDEE